MQHATLFVWESRQHNECSDFSLSFLPTQWKLLKTKYFVKLHFNHFFSFSLCLVFNCYDVSFYMFIFLSLPYLKIIEILGCRLMFFIKLGNCLTIIFQICFLHFSLFSSWDSHFTYIGIHDSVPQAFEALLYFLYSFFFPFLIMDYLIDLSSSLLIISSASSQVMLSLFSEFFISTYCTFQL